MVVPLSGLTFVFLSPEMAALYFLGCTAIVSITGDNIIKGLVAAAFGFAVGMIGRDPLSGFHASPICRGYVRGSR